MPDLCELINSGSLSPCTIVVFGGSGDLTSRKLVPALYKLFAGGSLPAPINIVGVARTALNHDTFRDKLRQSILADKTVSDLAQWDKFAGNLYYQCIIYDELQSYQELKDFLIALDPEQQLLGNRILYMAVPPNLSPTIVNKLGQAGLAHEANEHSWARIVVEKPFGRNRQTAAELDQVLHNSFKEQQIFRIDHYLAKETVQNILMLRFANIIFEPLWNRRYIDYVGIITSETLGIEQRAGYYEQAGVLRDMFQNHMMQLLALTAMEPPSHFAPEFVHDEKAKVFHSLKPLSFESDAANLVLGQYEAGVINNRQVAGYRQEPGTATDSVIPTFAMMRLFIDNWRWQGVPFYLVSGKRLADKVTRIVIQFKKVPHALFDNVLTESIAANRLSLTVYPEEKITMTFQTKHPCTKNCLRSASMDFKYYQSGEKLSFDSYEKVLLDCISGDHMLFWRQDGVELSWSFLTPVLKECETCINRQENLSLYKAGSWGPAESLPSMNMLLK